MVWIVGVLLLVYALICFSIKVVRVLSPHDLDVFRLNDTAAYARALRIAYQAPSMLNALGSARLLIQVLVVVAVLYWYAQHRSETMEVSLWVGWLVAVLGFSIVFTGIQRWMPDTRHPTIWLPRLSGFILFFKTLFRPAPYRLSVPPPDPLSAPTSMNEPQPPPTAMGDMVLYQNILAFDEAIVREIMQPRPKVVCIDSQMSFAEVLAIAQSSGFAAWPVCREDLDSIDGILRVKDIVLHRQAEANFAWQTLIRRDYLTVAETKPVRDLLQLFKQQHQSVAIVVDEHGTTAGFVTLEDVLEEVTGDLPDEFAPQTDTEYQRLDASTFLFDGAALLNDVCRWIGLPPDSFEAVRGDADTLAGLVLALYGDIPKVGDTLHWDRFHFTICAATERRVEQVKVRLTE